MFTVFPLKSSSDGHREADVLMDRVRNSVKDVVACNVFDAGVAPALGQGHFDVIISTLCLEFASVDLDEYGSAVRNVAALLGPSAHLILQVTNSSH